MSCQQRGSDVSHGSDKQQQRSHGADSVDSASRWLTERWARVLWSFNSSVFQGSCVLLLDEFRGFETRGKNSNQVSEPSGRFFFTAPFVAERHYFTCLSTRRETRVAYLCRKSGEVEKCVLPGARPLSDAWASFVCWFVGSFVCFKNQRPPILIHRRHGPFPCWFLTRCRHGSIHSQLYAVAEVTSDCFHSNTTPGRCRHLVANQENRPLPEQKCTELRVSQNLSPRAAPQDSPDRPGSTTRDTPRWTATMAGPTRRDSARGPLNWARSVAPRKVSVRLAYPIPIKSGCFK